MQGNTHEVSLYSVKVLVIHAVQSSILRNICAHSDWDNIGRVQQSKWNENRRTFNDSRVSLLNQ